MKKIVALILCLVLVLGLVACAAKQETKEEAPAEAAAEEKEQNQEAVEATTETERDYDGITLRVAWWGGDDRNNQTIEVLENFENTHKNLNVEVEYGSFGDYFTKLTTQATAGTLPDVYMMDIKKLAEFADGGVMENLDAYIESGLIDVSKASESAMESGKYNNVTYAVSTGSNAPAMFYDPVALAEAGVTLSLTPSYSELAETIDAVYAATGKKAMLCFQNSTNYTFNIYLRSMGMSYYNETKDAFGFTADDLETYLNLVYDLLNKESVDSLHLFEGDHFTQLQDENNYWLILSGEYSNNLASFETGSGKELELCCYPTADNPSSSGAYLNPSMLWAIASNSENKELAAEFISYFINEPSVYDICGVDRGVPISSEIVEYLKTAASPVDAKVINFVNTLLSENIIDKPLGKDPTGAAEAHTCLSELFEELGFYQLAKEDIHAAAQKAVENGNAILKANAAK